jgi:hypothetical protein
VLDCVDTKTYNLTETILLGQAGGNPARDIIKSKYWINEVSYSRYGKCHTLNNSVPLSSNQWTFNLDRSLTYAAFIHDPNYWLMTANPATMPAIFLNLDKSQGKQVMYIEVINHINFDRPDQPCEDQENYSFTSCVKNSVSRKVGCRYNKTC